MSLWDVVRLPFDEIRRLYRELRKILFVADRPTGTYVRVDVGVHDVEAILGTESYAPNWEFSYYERGEVLNLAQVVYEPDAVDGRTYYWWQTHVRGWETDDGHLDLHGHWELEPTENDRAHVDGVGYSAERGTANLRAVLEAAGVPHEEVTHDEAWGKG